MSNTYRSFAHPVMSLRVGARALVLGLVLASIAGCQALPSDKAGSEQGKPATEQKEGPMTGILTLTDADKGKSVIVKKGQTLRVELVGVPTAGYLWLERDVPAFLSKTTENTRPTDPKNQNQPGFTGGNHYLSFDYNVTGTGTATLVLDEKRPWETDEPPSDTWSVTLTAE